MVRPKMEPNGEPRQCVFLVKDILHSVHLQPLFGDNPIPHDCEYVNVLDKWDLFVVGMFSDQHIFRTFFPSLNKRHGWDFIYGDDDEEEGGGAQ
jgi:hypothetical protein